MDKKISIVIPYYDMSNGAFFLKRAIDSVMSQTYKNYEIILTKEGKAAKNTNEAIKRATGDLIKILHQDDYLAHKNALQVIVDAFRGHWLVTGCLHDDGEIHRPHYPVFSRTENTIGAPSVLTIKNGLDMYFNEDLEWMFDLEFYNRLYDKYGEPTILNDLNVVIGIGSHQSTNLLSNELKEKEEICFKNFATSRLIFQNTCRLLEI